MINNQSSTSATFLLIILLFAGIALRLFNLEVTGLWMDEIHSMNGTDPDKTLKEVLEYAEQDQPPFFFLLLYGWFKVFPFNDFSGRFFVVLTGCIGIAAMYYLGNEFKNNRVGLTAAFLTAINYFHVDFSRQVRFYPMVFLLSALSFLFFLRILKAGKTRHFILYIVATAALLNTHYFGLVVFASQFIIFTVIVLWKKIADVKFIGRCLGSGFLVGLSFVHWLPVVLSDISIDQFHIAPVPWYFPVTYYWVYFRDLATCLLAGILLVIAFRDIYDRAKDKSLRIEDVILVSWICLGFMIPLVYSIFKIPMLEYKYTFIVVPAILLLVAMGAERLNNDKLRIVMLAMFLLSFVVNSFFIKSIYFRKPFESWRELTQEIDKTYNHNHIVFTDYAWYLRYYFKTYKMAGQPYEPRFSNFKALTNQFDSIWVIRQTRYPDDGLTAEQEQHLKEHFELQREIDFTDSILRFYVRR